MKSTQTSFAKRALMVGLIAGSGMLAASSFALPVFVAEMGQTLFI